MHAGPARTLTIVFTNDIHSHFEQVSAIAAYATEERNRAGSEAFLLFDIGDHMDRAAMETEGTLGAVNGEILRLTGYDAITLGNNEGLTLTTAELEHAYAKLPADIVCCNLLEEATKAPPPWIKRSTILERGGVRVGVIGATAPFSDFYQELGLSALNPYDAIAEEVAALKGKTDILVLLSHLGLPTDRKLAEQMPEIDIILGGHTHHLLSEPLRVGNTVIGCAGKFGEHIGRMIFKRNEAGAYTFSAGGSMALPAGISSPSVDEALRVHRLRAYAVLSKTVASVDRALPIAYQTESSFGNLLAQAIRRHTRTELSLVNSGQLLGHLPQGDISAGLLHELCPSPINTCIVQLSGEAIRKALEESLLLEYTEKEIRGFGFRGKQLGGLSIDGLEVLYDPARIPYDRVVRITHAGEALRDQQMYTVGTIDMFTFGIGYTSLSLGAKPVFLLPEFLRHLLQDELLREGALNQSEQRRWIRV